MGIDSLVPNLLLRNERLRSSEVVKNLIWGAGMSKNANIRRANSGCHQFRTQRTIKFALMCDRLLAIHVAFWWTTRRFHLKATSGSPCSAMARTRLWANAYQSRIALTFVSPLTLNCRSPRFLAIALTHSAVAALAL